jgi:hypothetical protein
MSSITTAQPYEAFVNRHGQPTGPVRLPLIDRQLFIDAFNRRYQNAGLSITGFESSALPPSQIQAADRAALDAGGNDSR